MKCNDTFLPSCLFHDPRGKIVDQNYSHFSPKGTQFPKRYFAISGVGIAFVTLSANL